MDKSQSNGRTAFLLAVLGFCVTALTLLPTTASAQEMSARTAQLLPPGENSCQPLLAEGFTPYVYEGALHSFGLTIADGSYVSIAASVGERNIPFYQMLRLPEPTGAVRLHVDLESTPIGNGLPITLTLLSARGPGEPVCVSTVSTLLTPDGTTTAFQPTPSPTPAPAPSQPSRPSVTPAPQPTVPTPTTPSAPRPTTTTPPSDGQGSQKGGPMSTGTETTGAAVTQNLLADICSPTNAPRLWIALLAIYAILVAAVVFGKDRMPPYMRSQESVAAAIVVPFLLLFGLWYFAESCRISAWAPAIATIIALAGLAVAFWDRPQGPKVINLPSAKS